MFFMQYLIMSILFIQDKETKGNEVLETNKINDFDTCNLLHYFFIDLQPVVQRNLSWIWPFFENDDAGSKCLKYQLDISGGS